jgi:hypothetical protein
VIAERDIEILATFPETFMYSEKKRWLTEPLKKVLPKSESFQMRPKSQKNDKKFGRTL